MQNLHFTGLSMLFLLHGDVPSKIGIMLFTGGQLKWRIPLETFRPYCWYWLFCSYIFCNTFIRTLSADLCLIQRNEINQDTHKQTAIEE